MENETKNTNDFVGINEKIGWGRAFLLGTQHVLAMDLYIAPIIIAGMLALGNDTSFFIQMCFLAAGIATLIQTLGGLKLPVVQGPSYIPIGALGAIGSKLGLGAVFGALLPGALLIALLGYPLKVFAKTVKKIIPPLVGGTVIVIVGISLMPTAFGSLYEGDVKSNIIISSVTATILVALMLLGRKNGGAGTFFRLTSVVIAITIGTIVAMMFGSVSFAKVAEAKWFSLPTAFPFGKPEFNLQAVLTMVFIYFIILIETTGTWFVVGTVTNEKLNEKRLNKGAVGEGLGCLVGGVVGSTPMTGYSSNAGIIALTKVASKRAIIAAGIILVLLGLMPKLAALITCVPLTVINAIFGIVCVAIIMNGLKVIQKVTINDRNMMVIGIPILLTIGTMGIPADVMNSVPPFVNYILSSGTAVGAIAVLILNLIIPASKEDRDEAERNAITE